MKTMLHIKIEETLKTKAQKIAKQMGLPLSIVINNYLKQFVREQKVDFSVEEKLKPKVASMIKRAIEDGKKGINVSPAFTTTEEAISYLHTHDNSI